MKPLTVAHRTTSELEALLLRQLVAAREGMDAAELAMRIGCGAERVRLQLSRLEDRGSCQRRSTPSGPRWTAG